MQLGVVARDSVQSNREQGLMRLGYAVVVFALRVRLACHRATY